MLLDRFLLLTVSVINALKLGPVRKNSLVSEVEFFVPVNYNLQVLTGYSYCSLRAGSVFTRKCQTSSPPPF